MVKDVIIIGGGASGLTALIALLQNGVKNVTLLERLDRVGKKITATGNGQANLTNDNLTDKNYYSNKAGFYSFALKNHGVNDYKAFLRSIGIITVSDEQCRVYPLSKQANSVVDFMRAYLINKGADIRTGVFVTDVQKKGDFFIVRSGLGDTFTAKNVLLCTGGNAQKQFGTDGNGYDLAKKLGHTVTKIYPSLVQLKANTDDIKSLKGLKADVRLTAIVDGKKVRVEEGELLFTDYGVSGNAVFKISPAFAVDGDKLLSVEFLPTLDLLTLKDIIVERKKNFPYILGEELVSGLVHKQISKAIFKRRDGTAKSIANACKNFEIKITGTTGFNYAQVTRGGISANELDDKTMRSTKCDNLYLVGEVVDVDGDCGGYNLQWAYSSARTATDDIVRRIRG